MSQMNYNSRQSVIRKVAMLLAVSFLFQITFPTVAWALTSGPSQPEFSSFEPVSTNGMVNDFTGDFSYNIPVINIPGANGGGYAMSLSYHSGASPEQEASWVGYGWTLNPGAINRAKRGIADDSKGAKIEKWNKNYDNHTITVSPSVGMELFSGNLAASGINVNAGMTYNNFTGFKTFAGGSFSSFHGAGTINYFSQTGQGSFSASVNPLALLTVNKEEHEKAIAPAKDKDLELNPEFTQTTTEVEYKQSKSQNATVGKFNFSVSSYPTVAGKIDGLSFDFSAAGVEFNPIPLPTGMKGTIGATYNWQHNTPVDVIETYGFMYSDASSISDDDIMDYHIEKWSGYSKRDKYLGIPFTSKDAFSVSGEGMNNQFTIHKKKAGHFRPNKVASEYGKFHLNFDFNGGLSFGGGNAYAVGYHRVVEKAWDPTMMDGEGSPEHLTWNYGSEETNFMRMNNDMAGSMLTASNDIEQATIVRTSLIPGFKSFHPRIDGLNRELNVSEKRIARSSFVDYNTNAQMGEVDATGNSYRTFGKRSNVVYENGIPVNAIDRTLTPIVDGIGEVTTFSEEGVMYNYGLPVYNRYEGELSVDVDKLQSNDNYTVYKDFDANTNTKVKIGHMDQSAYASTYLLTEITNPDYLDVNHNGPDDNDFGGWVRFDYDRKYGHENKQQGDWFKWRSPYTGLKFNRGSFSSSKDDLGTMVYGEKEIYYLKTIETNTHKAEFYTSPRQDGKGADDKYDAAGDPTATSSDQLYQLDKIVLYKKNVNGQDVELKTVHFDYENTLCTGLPNANNGAGKLTLNKMWVEYRGVKNAKIAPYVFHYDYMAPSLYGADIQAKYNDITEYADEDMIQNPSYSIHQADAWGNYQYDGEARHLKYQSWVDQTPAPEFDPAAWQLKRIELPTGGQIQVQYEQKDYSYVQDQKAHIMAPLKSKSGEGDDKFYLDLSQTGVLSLQDKQELVNQIKRRYKVNTGEKKDRMYFKFLYALLGASPELKDCNAEYINGYFVVADVGMDDDNDVFIQVKTDEGNQHALPKQVCKDFYKTNRRGIVKEGICEVDELENSDPIVAFSWLTQMFPTSGVDESLICAGISHEDSYLRIPVVKRKLGGGVRVKRLLMYDQGLEPGDEVLYGSEYDYTTIDSYGNRISSGVTSTEPASIREENILVGFVERGEQRWLGKIIAGRDRKEYEGPFGESVLPSAHVGYSKVTVRNIHHGTTNTGIVVNEFHTYKDHPINLNDVSSEIIRKQDRMEYPLLVVNRSTKNVWMTQGWRFVIHDYHGKPKKITTYGGDPLLPQTMQESSSITFEYFDLDAEIPMIYKDNKIVKGYPGAEEEVSIESRVVSDLDNRVGLLSDVNLGTIGALVLPEFSFLPTFSNKENKLHTHITTKVIRKPVITKAVTTYKDGIYHYSENLAFSAETGEPLMVRTTDGYDQLDLEQSQDHNGSYTSYSYSASYNYPEMGPKFVNDGLIIKSAYSDIYEAVPSGTNDAYLRLQGSTQGGELCRLFPGDLVKLTDRTSGTSLGIYNVVHDIGSSLALNLNTDYTTTRPFSSDEEVNIEVIKSGRKNQLNAKVGNVTTYGESVNLTGPNHRVDYHYPWSGRFTCSWNGPGTSYVPTNVLSASAYTLKDDWNYALTESVDPFNGTGANPYQTGEKGKWRMHKNYVYDAPVLNGTEGTQRNYKNAGVYTNAQGTPHFDVFDWSNPDVTESNTYWKSTAEILNYDRNGNGVQEKNRMDIYSCVKFGYNRMLPYLTANNSKYENVFFESFENVYNNNTEFEDQMPNETADGLRTVDYGHSGRYCIKLNHEPTDGMKLRSVVVNNQIVNKGMKLRVWINSYQDAVSQSEIESKLEAIVTDDVNTQTILHTANFTKVARTGEWSLYEADLTTFNAADLNQTRRVAIRTNSAFSGLVYLDDIKLAPMDAAVNASVFDNEMRLVASFNDQHFGTFYFYNAEGKLTRKMIESEEGMRMLQEQEYNTPLKDRN